MANSSSTVFTLLFLYSIAMFTLPFLTFFLTKHVVQYFDGDDFVTVVISVIAAVIVVHIIIIMYLWHAFQEAREDRVTEGVQEESKKEE